MPLTRRAILGAGAAGVAATALGLPDLSAHLGQRGKRPKNVVFCVADGMAIQTLSMADQLRQMVEGRPSYWTWLMDQEFAVTGLQETRSLNSLVTDSAAASSSWGSGRRVWNGQINEFPDGTKLETLTRLMSRAGVRCGLVTTTTITHATPAGFAVNCENRDLEGLIAERYLASGVDVLMGGGNRFFAPDKRKDGKDLYADYAKAGFAVAKTRDEAMAAKGKRLLGIFSDGHLPYTVDRDHDPELQRTVPTLAEMARVALDNLKGSPNGFLLQIEGGKVDHGAHANDLAGMLYDQLAFEAAVKEAVDFAIEDGETLVVVTTDHACGGPSLNGAGVEYIDSTDGLRKVAGMKSSYAPLLGEFGVSSAGRIREVVEARLGVALTAPEAEAVLAAQEGKPPFGLSEFQKSPGATLAMVLGNHTKVTWTGPNHTSDHVVLTAIGPGREFAAGLTKNLSLFDLMLATKGLKHSNPTMTFEEAKTHYGKLKARIDPEFVEMYAAHDECGCHGHG